MVWYDIFKCGIILSIIEIGILIISTIKLNPKKDITLDDIFGVLIKYVCFNIIFIFILDKAT